LLVLRWGVRGLTAVARRVAERTGCAGPQGAELAVQDTRGSDGLTS
jgi:hypothetical protein